MRKVSEVLVELEEYLDRLVEVQDDCRQAVFLLQTAAIFEGGSPTGANVVEPVKRPRGRPRKVVQTEIGEVPDKLSGRAAHRVS